MPINISYLDFANFSREELKENFANDPRLNNILSIFDKLDKATEVHDKKEIERYKAYGENTDYEEKAMKESINRITVNDIDFLSYERFFDINFDDSLNDYEIEESYKEVQKDLGNDFSKDDYKKFIEYAAKNGRKNYLTEIEKAAQRTGFSKEMVHKLGLGVVDEYKAIIKDGKKYYERKGEDFSQLCDENGNLVEQRTSHSDVAAYADCEQIWTYDKNGNETSNIFINHKTGEQTTFLLAQNPNENNRKIHLKDGVERNFSEKDGKVLLEHLIFNINSPDSIKVDFEYDENNNLTNISSKKNTPNDFIPEKNNSLNNKTINIDKNLIENLKQIINNGARYYQDFELENENGNLKLKPKIINETENKTQNLENEALNKYIELISKEIHADEDFDIVQEPNGNLKFNYFSNQAKEFDCEYKKEIYDNKGNFISSLTKKNDEIILEEQHKGHKKISQMSFDDYFMQQLLEKNFAVASEIIGGNDVLSGGYNIYNATDKYKQITGRELIADVYDELANDNEFKIDNLIKKLIPHIIFDFRNSSKEHVIEHFENGKESLSKFLQFDPYNSQIAHFLPKIERIQTGENTYTEKIGNDKYNISFSEGKINIIKNGKNIGDINVEKFPTNYVKNMILKAPATVLEDITNKKCNLKLVHGGKEEYQTNGYYSPKTNQISLNPEATINNRALEVIVHETGHLVDCIDDRDYAIKIIKEWMKDRSFMLDQKMYNDKPVTVKELLEKFGTNHASSTGDEKLNILFKEELEILNNDDLIINHNLLYATKNLEEFFAEAYCLLNFGSCRCEYIIATYFSKSLARVKEMIDEKRATLNN